MLSRLLSTVVLLLLVLGSTSAEQREELQPTISTPGSFMSSISDWLSNVAPISPVTDDTIGVSSTCSLLFDLIGPFCQYVVPIGERDGGICQPGISMETCDNCQLMVQLCGTPDDMDLESICMSDLVPLCAGTENDPLIMDYCSVVQRSCGSGLGSGSGSVSESGSGSGFSGSGSGSGIEPTVPPLTTGSPGPTTTAEPTTNLPITTITSTDTTTATTTTTTTTTTTSIDTGGTLMTTTATVPTFTTMTPIVLVMLEDLTEQQRENVVTVGFTGLNEEQFLDSAITTFRMEVATMVNELLNQGQNRKKRQAPPGQVTPDDVIVIEPLRVDSGELLVSFVVGGQGDQSTPVSGTAVASLLQMEGPRLAMTLSNAIGESVQFVEAFITTTTDTTSELPTTSQFSTTRAPPLREESEQVQQLSSGVIAGIVISVLIVVVLVVAVVVVAIIALVLGYRNSDGMKLNLKRQSRSPPQTYIQVSRHEDSRFTSEWQSVPMNEYADPPTIEGNGGTNEHTEL